MAVFGDGSKSPRVDTSSSARSRDDGISTPLTSSSSASMYGESYRSIRGDRVGFRAQLVRAGALWLVGFKEACHIHRAVAFCRRSRPVLIKTGQCFILNGCIFLGSLFVLQRIFIPILRWFLGRSLQVPENTGLMNGDLRSDGLLQNVIVGVCYVFWLYPLYIISFVINIIWYNDIAKHAFYSLEMPGRNNQKTPTESQSPKGLRKVSSGKGHTSQPSSGIQGVVLQIGEQIYSVFMMSIFFLEVFAVSYVPYLGPLLNFIFMSWLYAYYCFDYKWGFGRWSLEKRLNFFETNWAFFSGFGSPCVLATYFLSPFVSAGVMNVLFPLFVLVATASNPEEAMLRYSATLSSGKERVRLPIFYLANNFTVPLLRLFQPDVSSFPSSIESRAKDQ